MVSFSDSIQSRLNTETRLQEKNVGFTAAYLGIQHLEAHILNAPDTVTNQTVTVILDLIRSSDYDDKRQSYFLFKLAAFSLISHCQSADKDFSAFIIGELQAIVLTSSDNKQRAVSEALGALPLQRNGPDILNALSSDTVSIDFSALLEKTQLRSVDSIEWIGRTLVISCAESDTHCCIKFLKQGQPVTELLTEVAWLSYLRQNADLFRPETQHIPEPVGIDNHYFFKLTGLPVSLPASGAVSQDGTAIVYITGAAYFHYLNDPLILDNTLSEVIHSFGKNAFLLGRMTANGIIHTALIPLFHNRIQQSRREDQGKYLWEHGGRLDQWLASCQYPNVALSGIRDFEHLISAADSSQTRHYIGEHLLAFILVAGSYFRNRYPDKIGLDEKGRPYDLRDQIDPDAFKRLIEVVVRQYYHGMTGNLMRLSDPLVTDRLIRQLIASMGMDNQMEEVLRIRDQDRMSDDEFRSFFREKGMTSSIVTRWVKGREDIVLNTGPHLGGFNRSIGIPELLKLLFCLSSLCVSDAYQTENGLKARSN